MFLDPPYSFSERATGLYAVETDCASEVREWCARNGDDPKLRIVLAGYDGEHNALEAIGWSVVAWKAHGGYGSQGKGRGRDNAGRERLWCSPQCLVERETEIEVEIAEQSALFA
jgi:DNA adenine methylase